MQAVIPAYRRATSHHAPHLTYDVARVARCNLFDAERRQLFVLYYDCARPQESGQTLSTAGPASSDEAIRKNVSL